jgi:hypothetical protein
MSMDDEGWIWAGSIHRLVHRYSPRTGAIETIELPYDANTSACLCAGEKVYMLGQAHPRLIVYDRRRRHFTDHPYPSREPDVWYGTEAVDGRHLYLFDRKSAGLIRWDTETEVGESLPYPWSTTMPSSGRYEPRDGAIWCSVADNTGFQYRWIGIARFDLASGAYTSFHPFPDQSENLAPYDDPERTLFLPHWLSGRVAPFDFKEKRWCQFLDVPGFGERFGFIGGPWPHGDQYFFSLSTYNGKEVGCDGRPYHFLNSILRFDPGTRRFDFMTLEVPGVYYQVSYMLSAGGEFFATCTNIREPSGDLNGFRVGEAAFWQSCPIR